MKKIIAIAAALLLTVTSFAQTGKSIYNKYSDADDVSAVYISPAMFRLIGKLPDMNMGGENDVNISPLIRSLDGFFLVDSRNGSINASLKAEAEKLVKGSDYELLMEVKDHGETVRMYTTGDDKVVTSFLMLASEKEECTFICMDGQMSRKDLEKAISSDISE